MKINKYFVKADFHLAKWPATSQRNRDETMFNFHMNSFDPIIENKPDFFIIKRKDITFKNVTKLNWELEQET